MSSACWRRHRLLAAALMLLCGLALAPAAQAKGPAAQITLALSPPLISADGSSQTTATATVTDAAGMPVTREVVAISSSDPRQAINPVLATDNGDGTYTSTITSSTTPGTSTITASDVGTQLQPATATLTQTSSSGTTLSVLPASTVSTNQLLTLIAAVAGSPSGTISFYNGYAPIANCQGLGVSSSNPVAVCEVAFAASASPVRVTAAFVPANGATGGSSQSQTVDVVAGSTTTSIRASNPSAHVGRPVTYTAFVTPGNPGPAIPSGSVKFIQGGKPLAHCSSVALQASGGGLSASCTVRYTTPGIRQVTTIYSGNQDFGGSSSSSIPVAVQALGRISSSMLWAFRYTPRYTTIASMSVNGVSLGTNVIVTCKGHGCPFARRVSAPSGGVRCTGTGKHRCGKGPIALAGTFHRNRLMVGTRITVEIRRPGWIGKFYSFVVVSGQTPQVRISCLAPGLSRPGIDC